MHSLATFHRVVRISQRTRAQAHRTQNTEHRTQNTELENVTNETDYYRWN
jgi:hypothetical protein